MKRTFSIILAALMVATMFTACGKTEAPAPAPTPAPGQTQPADPARPAEPAAPVAPFGPKDEIEFVSCFNPGGGHDIMLRKIEEVARIHNLIENPIVFQYKPGGNQAVGMQYTMSQKGRNDLIMSTTQQLISVPLQEDIGVKRENLTDLAIFGDCYLFFYVRGDSDITSMEALLNAGRPITYTSGGFGGPEEILFHYVAEKAVEGTEFRDVMVSGDPEGLTQLLGGHVDIFVNESYGAEDYLESGELKLIACSGPERSVFQPDVPTLREMGIPVDFGIFRGVMGPPDMSEEAVAYYQDLFYKVWDTPEFQDYLKNNGIEPAFRAGEEMDKYLDDYLVFMKDAYTAIGVPMVE